MKILMKFPEFSKETDALLLQEGWVPLKEPRNMATAILTSIPFMIILGIGSFLIISLFAPFSLQEFGVNPVNGNFSFKINLLFLPVAIAVILLHELIHVFFIPGFLHDDHVYFGLTWFGGFAYTGNIISRERFILVAVMPFFFLSVILPAILGLSGALSLPLKLLILLNAMASAVDVLNVVIVLMQVPGNGKLIMNGQLSYYRK